MSQFARNVVDATQLASFASTVSAQVERKWLLVDHGIVDTVKSARAAGALGLAGVAAFDGSALSSFGMSGPHLHELGEQASKSLVETLAKWVAIEPTAAGLSVVCSNSPLDAVRAALAYLAMTTVEGDLRLHCRCADARVLTNLLPLLTDAQARRVSHAIRSWWWLGATGSIEHWSGSAFDGAGGGGMDTKDHLHLSDSQFKKMMDNSEPDIMFALLLDKTSELVPETLRGEFRARLQRILGKASSLYVKQPSDRLQFVVLSLASGENFHVHPGLQPTWRNIRERGASLKQEMASWSDDLWAEIDNGRRPAQ